MKNLILTFCYCLTLSSLVGQFSMTPLGNHTYQMNSDYSSDDMHFYLFGDGNHSFESDPVHQFDNDSSPYEVVAYHSNPYDDQDPDEEPVGNAKSGAELTTNEAAEMMNMVQIKKSWNLVNGNHNFFILMIENTTSEQDPLNGCVEFHYDNSDSQFSTGDILDSYTGNDWFDGRTPGISDYETEGYTHKYTWTFDGLEYGEQRFIYIKAQCGATPYHRVKVAGVMKIDDCSVPVSYPQGGKGGDGEGSGSGGGYGTEPIHVLETVVSAFPHDPNIIVSDCNYLGQNYGIRTIPYTIHFNNNGHDPVKNVVVTYATSLEHVISIRLKEASHQVALNWHNHGGANNEPIASFTFEDIFLPGEKQNPPPNYRDGERTNGWVTFYVCYDLKAVDHCLWNHIDIYFDALDPVTSELWICRQANDYPAQLCDYTYCEERTKHEQEYDPEVHLEKRSSSHSDIDDMSLDFSVYPNPVTQELKIDISQTASEMINTSITDVYGRKHSVYNSKSGVNSYDVSDLPSGIYYIRIDNEIESKVKTFVKI